ncbi:hypothetical protein C6497_04810 [Candidatus Poribacteria bacterium]|nr:MAG: hypothetical protein C6497_04810 [Candidatus Poribacteria bacterium]
MEKDDVVLIDKILAGDDTAFSQIVNKYQKSVHALVWRKTGDFQVAEEIAQDTFLQAYQKLATLKNRTQFAGWLYVIASNLCSDWQRRKKPNMQSLEATNTDNLDRTSYENYVTEQREKAATERRQEIVKNLLNKLPESERTVVTLFYLGEMTSEAISKFLGVSVNTIKSRLRRARKRLQKEEPMIRETLGAVTLPVDFTENIMEKITRINPTPPSNVKPIIPVSVLGTAAILVMLLIGVASQILSNFQRSYSLDAESHPVIEIFDSAIPIDIQILPEPKRKIGNVVLANKRNGTDDERTEAIQSTQNQLDSSENSSILTTHWTQNQGPQTGDILTLFQTSKGDILGIAPTGIYKVKENAYEWMLLNNTVPIYEYFDMPMAEHKHSLYLVSTEEIYASYDDGISWVSIGPRPIGSVLKLLIIDDAFYLVLDDGIYRSTNKGKLWSLYNSGLEDTEITAATSIGNVVFIGTEQGVFRLQSDTWEQLTIGKYKKVTNLLISENTVYLGMVPVDSEVSPTEQKRKLVREMLRGENSKQWELFRSEDLGGTWTKITPRGRSIFERLPFGVKVMVADNTILVIGSNTYRSIDNGITWENLGFDIDSMNSIDKTGLAVNQETFYTHGFKGIRRTNDAGDSWNLFMNGIVGTGIEELTSFNNKLYGYSKHGIYISSDDGDTWEFFNKQSDNIMDILTANPFFTVIDNSLIGFVYDNEKNSIRICKLSESENKLIPIETLPAINYNNVLSNTMINETTNSNEYSNSIDLLNSRVRLVEEMIGIPETGGFAFSDKTFYVTYYQKLLKLTQGETKWKDTGLAVKETRSYMGFRLKASGQTVYVAREDGQLFRSMDAGESWNNITSQLPLTFKRFNEIAFSGTTHYVATDSGVVMMESGPEWYVIKDKKEEIIVMDTITNFNSNVYGACPSGIYSMDNGVWERISPELPDNVTDMEIHNGKFFIVTKRRGMFTIPIELHN